MGHTEVTSDPESPCHMGESFVESFVKVQIFFLLHSELLRPLVYPLAQFSCFVKPPLLFFSFVHACILLRIPLISQELFQILHLLRSFICLQCLPLTKI